MVRFILSKRKLHEQYDKIKDLGIISYSFKTNPKVGQILEKETSCMLSVHFINELRLIHDKSRVWFLAQSLNPELLDELFTLGVRNFVIENTQDLDTLLEGIKGKPFQIELLLRMKLKENTVKTERHYVFGMESATINKLIPDLVRNHFISKLGIHVHRKTQNVSEWELERDLSEIISKESFEAIDYLNIGGGIPVSYKNITDKVIDSVIDKISDLRNWLIAKDVALIIEPGRFLSGPCITLEAQVVGLHGSTIVVDASVYNSSPDTLIVPIKLLVEGETESGKAYVIKGITPCSTDIFRYRVYFPSDKEIKIGDKVRFPNAGAYNFHTEFCELDKVETVIE